MSTREKDTLRKKSINTTTTTSRGTIRTCKITNTTSRRTTKASKEEIKNNARKTISNQ